jgi:hypothetical protein
VGKKIIIGWANSRSEGIALEGMLRGYGIPVFSETGIAMTELTETMPSALYIDENHLSHEYLQKIEIILGGSVNQELLKNYRKIHPTETTETSQTYIPCAWFDSLEEARRYEKQLIDKGIEVHIELSFSSENPSSDLAGIFANVSNLTEEKIHAILETLGDYADQEAMEAIRQNSP